MKYKKGDDIYLKGQIVGVSSCSEVPFPYEVNTADEFIDVREKDIVSVNEPEKPVVSQFIADWYEEHKEDLEYNLYRLCINFHERKLYGDLYEWFKFDKNKPIETLILMHKFGYEVEKEKLYTVKFSNEDFGKIYIGIFKAVNKFGISSLPLNDDDVKSWFTKDELERFKFWNNPAFEIKEV